MEIREKKGVRPDYLRKGKNYEWEMEEYKAIAPNPGTIIIEKGQSNFTSNLTIKGTFPRTDAGFVSASSARFA